MIWTVVDMFSHYACLIVGDGASHDIHMVHGVMCGMHRSGDVVPIVGCGVGGMTMPRPDWGFHLWASGVYVLLARLFLNCTSCMLIIVVEDALHGIHMVHDSVMVVWCIACIGVLLWSTWSVCEWTLASVRVDPGCGRVSPCAYVPGVKGRH